MNYSGFRQSLPQGRSTLNRLHFIKSLNTVVPYQNLKEQISTTKQILSSNHVEGEPIKFLKVTEAYWKALKSGKRSNQISHRNTIISQNSQKLLGGVEFDVCVCGGTLGILVALTLQLQGFKVVVIEKRRIEGRAQEWNTSRKELSTLLQLGILTQQELDSCIATEYNPVRAGFKGASDIWIEDCLNVGLDPRQLLAYVLAKFKKSGGVVMEETSFQKATVYSNAVQVYTKAAGSAEPFSVGDVNRSSNNRTHENSCSMSQDQVSCRLLLDCMGHYSPIVKQVRGSQTPDGMCIVVGGCFTGIQTQKNQTGDLLYTFTDSKNDMQAYWEAFPAEGGTARTVYMFTYADAHPSRPSFEQFLDQYFDLLPEYQNIDLSKIQFKRVLMGGFPCYKDVPLKTPFHRVMQIGDASGNQSPLSFGGFGSLIRHLPRLSCALRQALCEDRLEIYDLNQINQYQPSLSSAWLFQRSMALQPRFLEMQSSQQFKFLKISEKHINELLACNFAVMKFWGLWCMKPFLQDTIQFLPLTVSMLGMFFSKPLVVMRVCFQVGIFTLLSWFKHYFFLGLYTLFYFITKPLKGMVGNYKFQRFCDAFKWGAGMDYEYV